MKLSTRIIATLLCVLTALLPVTPAMAQNATANSSPGSIISFGFGKFVANSYNNYGGDFASQIFQGNATTGSSTITIRGGYVNLRDGRSIVPYAVGVPFVINDAAPELITPTAVSGCYKAQGMNQDAILVTCSITASFVSLHGTGSTITSATGGAAEAVNDAFNQGGGVVVLAPGWKGLVNTSCTGCATSPTAALQSILVYPNVSLEDDQAGPPIYWNPTPAAATSFTAPSALTSATAFSSLTVAGSASYAGGTIHVRWAPVDIMGNEGPCSLTSASMTSVASKAIDVAAPVASAGAVGYVVYLSLSGGTYAQAYQIPSTSSNCTLTTLETVTPACAVANTTYGQAASTFGAGGLFTKGGSQITTYPVNTAMHFTKLGSVAMTAASLTPITNSSVTYSYAPSNRVGAPFISSANVVNYAASGSSATTIPNAIATWTIPANAFNYIGAEFTVSGKFTFTDGGDSSTEVRVAWDAPLSNATTVPTTLCSMVDTATGTGAAYNGTYFCTVKIATVGTTGTALVNGYANLKLAAGATTLVRDTTDVAVAPSAATVNTTAPARIVVYFIGTGATNNPGAQGLAATLTIAN